MNTSSSHSNPNDLDSELAKRQAEILAQNEELKAFQSRLEHSLEHASDLYQFAPIGYLILGGRGQILKTNQKARSLLGLNRKDLEDLNFETRVSAEFQAKFRKAIKRVVETSSEISLELRICQRQGVETWMLANIAPSRPTDEEGATARLTLCDITKNKRLEQQSSRQRARLKNQALELENLYLKQGEMTKSERERLGRELHDKVGTNLTCLGLYLSRLGGCPIDNRSELLETCRVLVEEVTGTIRNVIKGLRSPLLEDIGLSAALLREKERLGPLFEKLSFEFEDCDTARLCTNVEEQILLVAREALSNAVRHSKGSQIKVRFESQPSGFRLIVQDNGVGIDDLTNLGWGLTSMNERASSIQAKLEIHSKPDKGTQVILWQ